MTRLADFVAGRSMSELYDMYWVPAVLDIYARRLAVHVRPGDRVLDLSCGTGLVTGYAAQHAGPRGEVVGYDPTPGLLDAARSKRFEGAPIRWVEGFGEEMPFDDADFDVVLCHQGLQYAADRARVFSEMKRVLKPGAALHAGVWSSAADQPAFGFVEDVLAEHFGAEQKPIHAWSFGGLPELKRLADEAGLDVERLEQLALPARFESVQQFVDVQVACAGRTAADGQLAMGIVDLDDEGWLPGIAAFSTAAHAALGPFVTEEGLVAPFTSDEISARA